MTTTDIPEVKPPVEASSMEGVSCAAPSGSGPPRCQTCKHWTRQPDKVYQRTSYQKPVGPPQITRYGICSKLEIAWCEPASEDMLATNEAHCAEPCDTITTGPLFGCVHHDTLCREAGQQAAVSPLHREIAHLQEHDFSRGSTTTAP